jgi:membrane-associated phospholipid phosphatase
MSADEIIGRLRSNWALKIVLGTGLSILFAIIYLLPQHVLFFRATAMQPLRVDGLIPFTPGAVYLYESLYLIMPVAPWLMRSKVELYQYSKGLVAMNLVGVCFFIFYPTLCSRPADVSETNAFYAWLIVLDKPLNAFPSLHVAYALFHSACCHGQFSSFAASYLLRGFFWLWALGITASTLLTKQHVFVDAVAGTVLGLGCFALFCRPSKMAGERTKEG